MNCSQTVGEPRTNYTNIVFANKMFASVYAAYEKHVVIVTSYE